MTEIASAIRKLSKQDESDGINIVDAVVVSVDVKGRCCEVETVGGRQSVNIKNVALMASVSDGLLVIPKVGSAVRVCTGQKSDPFTLMFSEIDSLLYIVGGQAIQLTKDGIQLNDGSLGGLIKIEELVSKVNTIEKDINTLKTVFSGWTPVSNDGGAALKAAAGTWYGQTITETTKADLENTKITHGSSY